jgi:hypothetical protein
MSRVIIALSLLGLTLGVPAGHAQDAYLQPLKPTGFSAQAVALPPRSIGSTTLRARAALGVMVRVTVEDFIPRGLEPTLVIDGIAMSTPSGVTGVQGRITTLSFLVESPEALRDGASLAVQWGDDPRTRAQVPGSLRREAIQPADPGDTQRLGLPSLGEWLFRQPSR